MDDSLRRKILDSVLGWLIRWINKHLVTSQEFIDYTNGHEKYHTVLFEHTMREQNEIKRRLKEVENRPWKETVGL